MLTGKAMKKINSLHVFMVLHFPQQKELDEYLQMLEEAKKRDHRKLGKELGIYTMDDDVGPGLDYVDAKWNNYY